MFLRNILLAVGVLFVLVGLALSALWISDKGAAPPQPVKPVVSRKAILSAAHAIPAGTLLRPEDIAWKEVDPGEVGPADLLRGEASQSDFLGAITRRAFAQGEPLRAGDLVRPSERQFLSAVLRPGSRAVSISADAPQSVSGLVLPGDHVDIILTQNFGDGVSGDPGLKSVAETILRDVRVIALDQSLSPAVRGVPERNTSAAESRIPKTVSLELSEGQAEKLFVAMQLGKLQLAVRPLAGAQPGDDEAPTSPVWAADVSPALSEISRKPPPPQVLPSGSTVESAVRRPPSLAY